MSDWVETAPVYRRSGAIVPFCPYCGGELDILSLVNSYADCKCGIWSDNHEFKTFYKANPPKKPKAKRKKAE